MTRAFRAPRSALEPCRRPRERLPKRRRWVDRQSANAEFERIRDDNPGSAGDDRAPAGTCREASLERLNWVARSFEDQR